MESPVETSALGTWRRSGLWLGMALALGACSAARSENKGASLGAADGGARDASEPAAEGEDAGATPDGDAALDESPDTGADLADAAPLGAEDAGDDAASPEVDAGDDGGAPRACDARTVSASGCASGERSGLVDVELHPFVAACAGSWVGDVKNGASLCGAGFHLCRGTDLGVRTLAFEPATAFCGCFALDAAQDNYNCFDGCSEQADAGIDSYTQLDMAGVGFDCPYQFRDATGCLAGARIDATENDGYGCGFAPYLSGVLCCADLE
jgi:hypothetical protein